MFLVGRTEIACIVKMDVASLELGKVANGIMKATIMTFADNTLMTADCMRRIATFISFGTKIAETLVVVDDHATAASLDEDLKADIYVLNAAHDDTLGKVYGCTVVVCFDDDLGIVFHLLTAAFDEVLTVVGKRGLAWIVIGSQETDLLAADNTQWKSF